MDFWEDLHIHLDKCLSTYTEMLLLLSNIFKFRLFEFVWGFFFYTEVSFVNVEVEVEHDRHMNHYCVSRLVKVCF